MTAPNELLSSYANNAFSQAGEDGILREIFARLKIDKGTFCEFGAWDGQFLSNTHYFYKNGWSGWYIEGDRSRYEDLKRNITEPNIENICAFITRSGADTLDKLLVNSKLYKEKNVRELDLLSIDIDSDDLAIWKSVKEFRPKVVIIEFNPTIPIDVFFENPLGEFKGNSARSIYEHAQSIGYGLVANTRCNLIFVDKSIGAAHFTFLEIDDPSLTLGDRYFFGYDGSLIVQQTGNGAEHSVPELIRVPWSGMRFAQPVDRIFRKTSLNRPLRRLSHFLSKLRIALLHPLIFLTRKTYK
ncbi:MAG: hypothetical protein HKM95_17375 [Inquilinus sp.]|nr:hypothetical protein [Inquilinus sp.]